jgi:hypothetical protein
MSHQRHDRDEQEELNLEREQVALQSEEVEFLRDIKQELGPKILSFIKIAFSTGGSMALGPVLMNVGQKTKATVKGFDQNGAPFSGTIPPATYAIDNAAFDSSTPDGTNGDDLVSLSAGVANLTASLTSAEGLALTDTETVTNSAVVPVLSSIKIDFSTPA